MYILKIYMLKMLKIKNYEFWSTRIYESIYNPRVLFFNDDKMLKNNFTLYINIAF
jgi:hypothetical protein